MNIKRFNYLIKVMSEVEPKNFNIQTWLDCIPNQIKTPGDIQECGTTACIAGHLSVTPSWKQLGGTKNELLGSPMMWDKNRKLWYDGYFAIAKYLDCSFGLATKICSPNWAGDMYKSQNPTPAMVVRKLKKIKLHHRKNAIFRELCAPKELTITQEAKLNSILFEEIEKLYPF